MGISVFNQQIAEISVTIHDFMKSVIPYHHRQLFVALTLHGNPLESSIPRVFSVPTLAIIFSSVVGR